jgi:hypothetical protein
VLAASAKARLASSNDPEGIGITSRCVVAEPP